MREEKKKIRFSENIYIKDRKTEDNRRRKVLELR